MRLSWFNDAGELEAVEFDTYTRENRDGANTIADHPVGGRVYSDHVVVGPARHVFDCYVSDSPGEVPTTQTGGVTGTVQQLALEGGEHPEFVQGASSEKAAQYEDRAVQGSASVLAFDGALRRRELVHRQLEALRRSATVVYVTGAVLGPVDAVQILRVGAMVDDAGDGATFTLELREVLVADSATVEVPDEPRARRPRDAGGTTTTVEPETSVLFRAFFGGE